MKITESTVALATQRTYQEQHKTTLNINIEHRGTTSTPRPVVDLSATGKAKSAAETDPEQEIENDPRLLLIKSLIEMLTGREFKLFRMKLQSPDEAATQAREAGNQAAEAMQSEGGFAIEYLEEYIESESVDFQAAGIVKTADGREIRFEAELNMSRSFQEEIRFSAAGGSLARPKKDPLVLNYDAPAATLSSQTFTFDIDTDGQTDNISLLNRGSAYLAQDMNNDGKINDGKELFGTQSGDGFADLARHDNDHNGWIDENDVVFAELRLWIKDASGTDKLLDLKAMGIGALYLGKASSDFSLKDAGNRELGQSRATGLYLNENGSGGTMQQIDLVA